MKKIAMELFSMFSNTLIQNFPIYKYCQGLTEKIKFLDVHTTTPPVGNLGVSIV
jgi:hypothetical protein